MRIHTIEFETRVGFKLPSAGVTPAPSVKKSQNSEDAILLPGSFFLCHSAFPVSFQSGCCVITAELAKITHVASVELDNDDQDEIKIDVTVMDEDDIEDVRRQVPPKIEGYDTEVTQYVGHAYAL